MLEGGQPSDNEQTAAGTLVIRLEIPSKSTEEVTGHRFTAFHSTIQCQYLN